MRSKLILLNGPAGCGKTTAFKHLRQVFAARDGRTKARLLTLASELFLVPVDFWESRDNKEAPNFRLGVTEAAYKQLMKTIEISERNQKFTAKHGYYFSPREALIYVSEVLIKPTFGGDYFGRWRADNIRTGGIFVDDSAGFTEEVCGLANADVLLIRIHGRGEFGRGDSRKYLDVERVTAVDVDNTAGELEFLQTVVSTVRGWLKCVD